MDTQNTAVGATENGLLEKVAGLTKTQRILITAGVFVLVLAAAGWLLYWPAWQKIEELTAKLDRIEKQLEKARKNAAELDKFKAKMQEAEAQFRLAMKALPEKDEIPMLLTSISRSGQDVGLEFLLFEPRSENKKEFYAEIPVAMNLKGDYHNTAVFFDKVARLSRIVNIRNITMSRIQETGELNTSCMAVTYKFVEPAADKDGQKDKKGKK